MSYCELAFSCGISRTHTHLSADTNVHGSMNGTGVDCTAVKVDIVMSLSLLSGVFMVRTYVFTCTMYHYNNSYLVCLIMHSHEAHRTVLAWCGTHSTLSMTCKRVLHTLPCRTVLVRLIQLGEHGTARNGAVQHARVNGTVR